MKLGHFTVLKHKYILHFNTNYNFLLRFTFWYSYLDVVLLQQDSKLLMNSKLYVILVNNKQYYY